MQPHRQIVKLEENLWTVDSDIKVPGGVFIRKMALMRLEDGRIVIHSAILLDASQMDEIERWGTPAFCIVPNRRHRLDARSFRTRYPKIKLLCPAASRHWVEQVVVAIDGGYDEVPPEIEWRSLAVIGDEAVFIHRSGARTALIFADALFNAPHFGGPLGLLFKLIGSTGGPRVTPLSKLMIVSDRRQLASQYRELAEMSGLARLIPGHGENINNNAAAILRLVADQI
jgi:hypothetical protein